MKSPTMRAQVAASHLASMPAPALPNRAITDSKRGRALVQPELARTAFAAYSAADGALAPPLIAMASNARYAFAKSLARYIAIACA